MLLVNFAHPSGRITEFKVDKPGHSVSVHCQQHSKCRKVLLFSRVSNTFQAAGCAFVGIVSVLCVCFVWYALKLLAFDQFQE